jgi:hypothetical protein
MKFMWAKVETSRLYNKEPGHLTVTCFVINAFHSNLSSFNFVDKENWVIHKPHNGSRSNERNEQYSR